MHAELHLIDRVIRGAIRTFYDFITLSLIGPIFPFLFSRRLLLTVLRTGRRFTTITHLAVWTIIVVAILSGNQNELASGLFGLRGRTSIYVIYVILVSLFITIIADALLALLFIGVKNKPRKRLCLQLGRLSVANIMIAGSLIGFLPLFGSIFAGQIFSSLAVSVPFHMILNLIFPFTVQQTIVLFLFALPLACLVPAGYKLRYLRRIPIWLFVPILFPSLLFELSLLSYLVPMKLRDAIGDPPVQIFEKAVQCRRVGNKVKVDTFLKLEGGHGDALPIQASHWSVYFDVPTVGDNGTSFYLGTGSDDQPAVLILKDYKEFNLTFDIDQQQKTVMPREGQFKCFLSVALSASDLASEADRITISEPDNEN